MWGEMQTWKDGMRVKPSQYTLPELPFPDAFSKSANSKVGTGFKFNGGTMEDEKNSLHLYDSYSKIGDGQYNTTLTIEGKKLVEQISILSDIAMINLDFTGEDMTGGQHSYEKMGTNILFKDDGVNHIRDTEQDLQSFKKDGKEWRFINPDTFSAGEVHSTLKESIEIVRNLMGIVKVENPTLTKDIVDVLDKFREDARLAFIGFRKQ